MTIVYRTAGPWGAGKGANLTPAEVDTNFYELRTDVDDLTAQFVPVVNIAYFSVAANALFVHMTDHSILGPYPIPMVGLWTFRDEWLPDTTYLVNDMVTFGNVLYLVLIDHTSAGSFDPDATNGLGDNYYAVVLEAAPAIVETWNFQGVWEPLTSYFKFDVVTFGTSIYLVLQNHESAATFDPDETNINGPLYSLILDLGVTSGLPAGGDTGQALVKHSGADYDVTWANVSGLPAGGTTGQFLGKTSAVDYAVSWQTPPVSIPAGGATGAVLTKHSGADYDVSWQTPAEVATKWYAGSGAPTTTFNNGDFYLNTANGDVYQQVLGSWSQIGNIRGATGAAGANGFNGSTWYNGTAAPGSGVGVNGDYFLNVTTGDYYQKQSGSWVLIGTITPTSLPTGGTAGQVLTKNSATNFDASWATLPNDLPTGGTTGQVLTKDSGTNYDVSWQTPSGGGGSEFWPPNNGSFTAPPTIASSAWTNFGSGLTSEDFSAGSTNGVRIRASFTGGDNICGIYKTQSFASDFTAIAGFRIRPFMHPIKTVINGGGLLFMTSGGTSGVFVGQYASQGMGRVKFTALTSGVSSTPFYSDLDINNDANYLVPLEFWIRAVWNQSAGTLTLSWSLDANYWTFSQSYNPSATDSFTFTRIGMAINTNGGGLGSIEQTLDCAHLSIA